MRSHAKAPSAESISARHLLHVLLGTLAMSLVFAGVAQGAKVHPFKEVFGSAAQPTFSSPRGVAVDQSTGNVLVLDGGTNEKQTVEVAAEGGFYKLTFGGQTTGWAGAGTVTCNGISTSITGVTTSTGAVVKTESIRSTPGSCIKPNTTITGCVPANCVNPTSFTISQVTENVGGGTASVNLAADLTIKSLPTALTAAQITTQIREALGALPSVGGTVNVLLSGSGNTSPVKRTAEFFTTLGGRDVEPLVCDASALTGVSPSCAVATTVAGFPYGIKRFAPDGSPVSFTALGTNVIDGRRGPGGKVCAEELSSCDETPQNSMGFIEASASQIAVDNSGSSTDGNIYVTQASQSLVDVFNKAGQYLGQLTKFKEGATETPFGEICGVAVGPGGTLYLGDRGASFKGVYKFTSAGAVPVASDFVTKFPLGELCSIAAGAGPTSGYIFVDQRTSGVPSAISKVDAASGEIKYLVTAGNNMTVAVDPASGRVLASGGTVATEFEASGAGPVQTATLTAAGTVQGAAVRASTGDVYVARSGNSSIEVFLPPAEAPEVVGSPVSGIAGTKAVLAGEVNPKGGAISECKFEYIKKSVFESQGGTFAGASVKACEGSIPTDSSFHQVNGAISGLTSNTAYVARLSATNPISTALSAPPRSFTTATIVFTDPATSVGTTTATLNGKVRIEEGVPFTACTFEYLTETEYIENGNGYSGLHTALTKPCAPAIGTIEADFQPHTVSAVLTGLQKNMTYHFRLSAMNVSGTVLGSDQSFLTLGGPQIVDQFASVNRTSATLKARINPSGFATTYHFEWGPDGSLGMRVPDHFDLFVGSGTTPVEVGAEITGLIEGTPYHFRVVASNSSGTIEGANQEFMTLNDSGLPDGRGFELVSPVDKRPQGGVGTQVVGMFQVATDGQSVAYPLLGGLEDSDSGGDTVYVAERGGSGWESSKVSPPSLVPNPLNGLIGVASPGDVSLALPDLSCAVINTFNPLTDDTPVADVELGVYNLYVRDEDGAYRLITDTVPSNPEIGPWSNAQPHTRVAGISADCKRVYFKTKYDYLPNASGLYEWDDGVLRDAGRLPNGSPATGEVGLGGEFPGAFGTRLNSSSRDGERFFFTAFSNEPATTGVAAVFVRKDGTTVAEASRKQAGAKDSLGSRYEVASPDGSHVFFTATYGLTPSSSAGPSENCANTNFRELKACDLYDYEVDTGQLTNLSATSAPANTKGSVAQGVIAVSEDGSSVYFAARGQLIPGKGNTYAQNTAGFVDVNSPGVGANVYLARNGQLSYVATVAAQDVNSSFLVRGTGALKSAATPDGEHLLFESTANVTGYESGGVPEAYLYSADTDSVVCLSCRRDGQPSVGDSSTSPLWFSTVLTAHEAYDSYQMSEDGSRVFFTMPDVLAPGAVSGNRNIYEWEDGQVYLLLTGTPETGGLGAFNTQLYGASASGEDVFIRTPQRLTPYDVDLSLDLYDIRVGGGFPPPPPPAVPCNPAADECQGTPVPQPAAPAPPSAAFSGPGNPAPPALKQAKKKAKKTKKRHRKNAKRADRSRAANNNRGGAK